jgi:hypothetical protein
MHEGLAGFFSYARHDAKHHRLLNQLQEHIEAEVKALTGVRFQLFLDTEDIKPGEAWAAKLRRAVDEAAVFLPVVTPTFLASPWCREETRRFVERERRLDRDDLIFPILLTRIDQPWSSGSQDPLATVLREHQWLDIVRYRHQDEISVALREDLDRLTQRIAAVLAGWNKSSAEKDLRDPGWPPASDMAYVGRVDNHEVFVLLRDGRIWHSWWPGDHHPDQWNEWWVFAPDPPGKAIAIAAASWGERTYVFVLTEDGRVFRGQLTVPGVIRLSRGDWGRGRLGRA